MALQLGNSGVLSTSDVDSSSYQREASTSTTTSSKNLRSSRSSSSTNTAIGLSRPTATTGADESLRRHLDVNTYDYTDPYMWELVGYAASLSMGIYFGNDIDLGLLGLTNVVVLNKVKTSGPVPYIVTYMLPTGGVGDHKPLVMVAFRGMELEEPSFTEIFTNDAANKFSDIAQDIRDSPYIDVADRTDSTVKCSMNEALVTNNLNSFDYHPILLYLETCRGANGGIPCELYLVGHSQGGVMAQATAIRLQSEIRAIQNDDTYSPKIFAFGSPSPHDSGSTCGDSILDENKIYNFWNLRSYMSSGVEHTVFDVAVTLNVNDNGNKHLGHKFVFHNDNRHVKHYGPNDTYQIENPKYNFKNLATDDLARNKLKAHLATIYDKRLNEIETDQVVNNLDGFDVQSPCKYTEQCQDHNDGSEKICHHHCRKVCPDDGSVCGATETDSSWYCNGDDACANSNEYCQTPSRVCRAKRIIGKDCSGNNWVSVCDSVYEYMCVCVSFLSSCCRTT